MNVTRPQPSTEAHEGFHWEAVELGPEWRVATREEVDVRGCRHSTRRKCPNPVAVALNRGWGRYSRAERKTRDAWWFYCAAHAYGRWVEDGKVMGWRAVKDAS